MAVAWLIRPHRRSSAGVGPGHRKNPVARADAFAYALHIAS